MSDILFLSEDELKVANDRGALQEHADKVREYALALVGANDVDVDTLELADAQFDAVTARIEQLDKDASRKQAILDKFTVKVTDTETGVSEDVEIEVPAADSKSLAADMTKDFYLKVNNASLAGKFGSQIKTAEDFGKALADAHKLAAGSVNGRDTQSYAKLFSTTVTVGSGETWGMDDLANFKSFSNVIQPSAVAAADPDAEDSLVASGGYCKPLNTSYDIPFYAESCPTLDEFLPSVLTNDGGIKFMRPPTNALVEAAQGIAIITCDEDKAGYDCETPAGPTPCKPCTRISCPTTEECCIDMITQCISFGNLNWRTFPQQVEYSMKAMAVAWNRKKNQYFLDKLDDPANTIPVVGGASEYTPQADIFRDLVTLAARYRSEYGKCCGQSVLKLALPCWAKDQLMINAVNRGLVPSAGDAELRSFLRSHGFDIFFYEGSATGANQTLAPQGAGNIVPLPTVAVAYLFSPDSFTVLRGGVLDFGLVRDSSLNHANNLEIMLEEFIGFCRSGVRGYRIELNICPQGLPGGVLNGVAPTC